MNWGNRLIVVFIVFGGMISYMVYRCMRTPVDLVSANYYKEELAYQEVIDGTRAANGLSARPKLREQASGDIDVQMPAEMNGRLVDGFIIFYCPSDMARDRQVPLEPDQRGRQLIAGRLVPAGVYTVKLSWKTGGKQYYSEQSMEIH